MCTCVRSCGLLRGAGRAGLFVMRVACFPGGGGPVTGCCLHCCLSCRWCRQVAPCDVFVNVINTASAHVRVSRLTFGLCLNSLSLTAQQHDTHTPPSPHTHTTPLPPPNHPPPTSCLSSATARPSRRLMFGTSLTVPRFPL